MRKPSLIVLVFLVLSSPLPNLLAADEEPPAQAAPATAASPAVPPAPSPLSDADRAAYFEILMQVRQAQAQENAARVVVLEAPAKMQQLLQQLVAFTREKNGGAPCELDSKAQWQCQGAPTSAKSQ